MQTLRNQLDDSTIKKISEKVIARSKHPLRVNAVLYNLALAAATFNSSFKFDK